MLTRKGAVSVLIGSLATLVSCKGSVLGQSSGAGQFTGTTQVPATSTGNGNYTIDFGSVAVGQDEPAALTLNNTGTSPLQIISVSQPSDAEFSIDLTTGVVIGQGQPLPVNVDFKPFSVGSKSATVVIQTDSATVPTLTLTLQGIGVALKLGVDPQIVDFGTLVVHTSLAKIITLTNMSDLDLVITPSAVQGTGASLFTVSQGAVFTLKANGTTQIQATYAPLVSTPVGVEDKASFTLTLSTGSPVTISLQGNAVQDGLQISPNPMDFNFVQPGQQRTIPLHILNVGNRQVSISSISVTIPVQVFELASGAPTTATLDPQQSVDVSVTFTPIGTQQYLGELTVVSNDNNGEQAIPLQGYGGGAAITCQPMTLAFGLAPANFTTTLPVICTNTGTNVLLPGGGMDPKAELVIDPTKFKLVGSQVFGASIDPQSTQGPLVAGQPVILDVTYTPTGTENDTATLTVASNVTTPPAPPVLNLSGQGIVEKKCYYSLTPSSLNWGEVKPGGNVYTQAFTITNLGPNECLVNAVDLLPTSDPAFTMTQIASQRLSPPGPGALFPTSLVVPVSFQPQQTGSYGGTVGFGISDPDGPNVQVPLAGKGGDSCFIVKPADVNFGVVGLSAGQYCSTGKKTFVGVNGCATPVTITGLTLSTGTSASPFAILAETIPVTVQAGSSSPPFQVGFKPTASGSYYSSAQVQTDLQQTSFGVFFQGTAATGDTQTDEFTGSTPSADILWVMDTDDDPDERKTVAEQASGFVSALVADGLDFQIGVTSSDVCPGSDSEQGQILGCPNCHIAASTPTIVTSADPNAAADLTTLMTLSGATNGCSPDEQFFETAYEAVVSGTGATYNNSNAFIRQGAYLAIVTVNGDNEDDNSQKETVDWYANQFLSVKGNDHPELFSWSYINPSQFGTSGGGTPFDRLPARIAAMLKLVGGVALDTTQDNWFKGILDLWNIVLASSKQFALSGTPDPTSIKLYLDGPPPDQATGGQAPGVLLQATNPNQSWNWQYEPLSNTILVNPATVSLQSTDTLYAEYTLVCGN